MNFEFIQFIVPIAFFWYAYSLLVQKPAFNDTRRGFPTRRARERKEIWNYVQRVAGICCIVLAVLQIAATVFVDLYYPENELAYWIQMGFKGLCIVAIFPIVNILTNRKFPKKKKK